jgi:hypothetical protein
MANFNPNKTVYLIVHGQRHMEEKVREKLVSNGIKPERIQLASLGRAGESGEYVAMIWPPTSPSEIRISEIVGKHDGEGQSGMGAWASIERNDIQTITL